MKIGLAILVILMIILFMYRSEFAVLFPFFGVAVGHKIIENKNKLGSLEEQAKEIKKEVEKKKPEPVKDLSSQEEIDYWKNQ